MSVISRLCVRFCEWVGWLDIVDQRVVNRYLTTTARPSKGSHLYTIDPPYLSNPIARGLDQISGPYVFLKPIFDKVLAVFLLVVLFPLLPLIALMVKATSRGPIWYFQQRVGKDGRIFQICKFRTLAVDGEFATGPVWVRAEADPRITSVGRVLRRWHLDELPQLLNVIEGSMSLVGPRPERPEFVSKLELQIPGYSKRFQIKPGITGLAHALLPPDLDLDSVRRKTEFDLYYIRHVSFWLDMTILVRTILDTLRPQFSSVIHDVSLMERLIDEEHDSSLPRETSDTASSEENSVLVRERVHR